ncbi:MAG: TolC family protein, partial [Planctomycetota bacterium]
MAIKIGDRKRVSRWVITVMLAVGGCMPAFGQKVEQGFIPAKRVSPAQRVTPSTEQSQLNPATPTQELPIPESRLPLADPIRLPDADAENPGAAAEAGMIEDDGSPELVPPPALTVADVIASVYRSFPEIIRAREQARLANGLLLEAYGAYDTKLKAETLNEPTGFYENYRHGIGLARQNWWGGNVSAGYRVGRGEFQPWYLERETEVGGEFKLGYIQPLLQGFAIDPQRLAVFQASLERQAADPILQQAILETARDAIMAYWAWVASGATLSAQQNLLRFAETRGRQFEELLKVGAAAEIDVVLNQQLIAERRGNVIKAEQKYRANALKLSVFLRDEQGQPLLPDDDWLLPYYPVIDTLPDIDVQQEIVSALQRRPEPRRLQIELRQLSLDRQLARNQFLP